MHPHDNPDGCATPGRRRYRVADEVVDAFARLDRLKGREEVDAERLDGFVAARRRTRRKVRELGSALCHGTVASPLRGGADASRAWPLYRPMAGGAAVTPEEEGVVHALPSIEGETVHVGVFDPALPPVLTIESGDTVSYPDTMTHYAGRLAFGMSAPERETLRAEYPAFPHSNVGPVALRDAEPGDVIECRILKVDPIDWGYNNSAPGRGTLPDDYDRPHVRYFRLDLDQMTTEFMPGVEIPLGPFQGILGVQPAGDQPAGSGPPGPYGGNMDLRELVAGTTLFVPVFHPGGKLWTSDSHAAQGDGEVNLTAIETAMREVRIQYVLHKQVGLAWPMVETPTHWISLGMDPDLDEAHVICLRQMIQFLEAGLAMDPLDAYSLCSIAVTFRITQTVDGHKGVHGMLPKDLFRPDLRERLSIVTPRSRAGQ
ncbi:MAG TPA: acetamidase/formamidase family protein [Chloroflexota bacterium]|jgi:acetamidase/formamidase